MNLVVGRVSTNPRGFAFVDPETPDARGPGEHLHRGQQPEPGDAWRPRRRARRAHARATAPRAASCASSSAARERIVGRYDVDASGRGFVVPFDRRLIMDVQVADGRRRKRRLGRRDGRPWRSRGGRRRRGRPSGRVTEVLGRHRRPWRGHGRHHPEVQPAGRARRRRRSPKRRRLGAVVRERDLRGRTDFRDWPTVTIDGEHARDFDDAISIDRLPNGNFWLGVHIADVAHYVAEGSALDDEAYDRSTSVYFPERAVHMFPSELSTGLCSLNPHVDRLVQSCLMEVDGRSGRGRALRDARRRHPQPRADDLHGGQRDPDGPRPGNDRALPAARADVRAHARAVRAS